MINAPLKTPTGAAPPLKRCTTCYVLSALTLLLFSLYELRIIDLPLVDRLELMSYDARLRLTMPHSLDRRLVIVDIDNKSLAAIGRWPWSRNQLANLLNSLFDHYQVAAVGFDVVFAEPDYSSGLQQLEKLGANELKDDVMFQALLPSLRDKLDYDSLFAKAISNRRIVLGYYFEEQNSTSGKLPPPALTTADLSGMPLMVATAGGYGANLASLEDVAAGAGHFNPDLDIDGVVRSISPLIEYQGQYYESLSLAMVRELLNTGSGKPTITADFSRAGLEGYKIGDPEQGGTYLPVNERGQLLVPYRGPQGSFPYVSAVDALQGTADPNTLYHKVILVGTTSPGLMDMRSTPMGTAYAGVEVHANLISGILDHTLKAQPRYTLALNLLMLLSLGLVTTFLLPMSRPLLATLITMLMLTSVVAVNLAAWLELDLVLPLVPQLLLVLVIFVTKVIANLVINSNATPRPT